VRRRWAYFLLAATAASSVATGQVERPTGKERYDVQADVLIRTEDGATLSATVVRGADSSERRPALLTFDIYTDPAMYVARGKDAVDHGYVGVVADVRGKRLSPDPIIPYEHDAADTYAVIDWIARQPWSDGRVGMRGGSYSGFTAWAATKRLHRPSRRSQSLPRQSRASACRCTTTCS